MTPARIAIAFATGAWLAVGQVALGFALMQGGGAATSLFYSMVTAWIAGAALGVAWRRIPAGGALPVAGSLVVVGAQWLLRSRPFEAYAVVCGIGTAALVGAYAGAFLRDRSRRWGAVRAILFHENNGFVAGYVGAAAILFADARGLEVALGALAVALYALERRDAGIALDTRVPER